MRLVTMSKRSDGIFSEWFNDEELHFCFSLEHAFWNEVTQSWEPIIPRGRTFPCKLKPDSDIAGVIRPRFQVTGVEGHTGLTIHKGALNKDSLGCIILGEDFEAMEEGWAMLSSGEAFDAFMELQGGLNEFLLTVD